MKVNFLFDMQFGLMLQIGKTYRKEPYLCILLPFCTLQITIK